MIIAILAVVIGYFGVKYFARWHFARKYNKQNKQNKEK